MIKILFFMTNLFLFLKFIQQIRCQIQYYFIPNFYIFASFVIMGNQQCCQAANKGQSKHQKVQLIDYHPQILPQLSQPIKNLIANKKPFHQQLKAQPQIVTKQYGQQFYQGPVDPANRPAGYGKMYKKDGSLVIAHWKQGRTQGPAIFIFPDGSYYEGILVDNKAEDQNGIYVNSQLTYEGGFHQNAFNGKGKQKGNGYSFEGDYINGRKAKGTLRWRQNDQDYEYEGQFNENFQFQGQGILKQGSVGSYKGTFNNGKKHGRGVYSYAKNDIRYEGQYKDGMKNGNGTIYNHDNSIAYSGNFQNDLPNGQGYVIDHGRKNYGIFKDGIDIQRL